jgi:hypothetical protein
MARIEVPITVMNPTTGLPVNGASVAISQRVGGTAATWWTAETAGSSSTNAVITDALGRASAWVARGTYNLTVSGAGLTTYVEPFDALPAADKGGDGIWLPDAAVTNVKVASGLDASKLTTGSLPSTAHGANTIPTSALQSASVTMAKMATGAGQRVLGASGNFGGNLSAGGSIATLGTVGPLTHNSRPALCLFFIHFLASTLSGSVVYRIKLDGTSVATQSVSMIDATTVHTGIVSVVYTSASLSGSHTWTAGADQTGGNTVYHQGAVMIVLEQY